jgi:hypothetical protein
MVKRMLPRTGLSKSLAPIKRSSGQTRNTRRHSRRACSVETLFAAERQLFEGTIKNLSAGGTYIQVKGRFILGGEIIVAGPFAADQDDVKRRGKIVRMDGTGIAVRFIH